MGFRSFFAIFASNMANDKGRKVNTTAGGYRRVIKYLGIFGGAQGFSVFLSLLRNKVAFMLLGAVGFGFIALYNRTVQLFSDFTGLR